MAHLLAARSSTTTGVVGTGGRLSILVCHHFSDTLCHVHMLCHVCVNTGVALRKSVEKAWKWGKAQREVANSLDDLVSESTLQRWEQMVIEYKLDHKKPNPFEEPEACTLFSSLNLIAFLTTPSKLFRSPC